MRTSENIADISAALAKAQAEMSNPKFDTQNPFFKNRYASLAAVRDAVVPVLAKHALSMHQDLTSVEGGAVASTLRLHHASGQWMEFGPLTMPVSKQDAQGYGSAATYARRYQLMAACGVVGDNDDDADAAVGRNGNGKHVSNERVSEKQVADLSALMTEVGADKAKFLKYCKIDSLDEILAANYGEVVKMLERKRAS